MSVYSELFARGSATTGTTNIFTVPSDGNTYVLRDIILAAQGAGNTEALIYKSTSAIYADFKSSAQYDSEHFPMRQVLVAGDVLILDCITGGFSYTLSGYRLAP